MPDRRQFDTPMTRPNHAAPASAPEPQARRAEVAAMVSPADPAPELADPLFHGLLDSPPPPVSASEAEALLLRHYGLRGRAQAIACERDANFHILSDRDVDAAEGYVLKIANPAEPAAALALQNAALERLARQQPDLPLPRLCTAPGGQTLLPLTLADGRQTNLRLMRWIEGTPLARSGFGPQMPARIGQMLARINRALADFTHPAMDRQILWDIRHTARLLPLIARMPGGRLRTQLTAEVAHFAEQVVPVLPGLPWQVIHNDMNHHNIVIDPARADRIAGVLDFGDMVRSARVVDVAVAAAYVIATDSDPLAPVCALVAAYHGLNPLTPQEIAVLRDLIVARLVTSVTVSSWRAERYPDNAAYILRNSAAALDGLARFASLPPDRVTLALRQAAESVMTTPRCDEEKPDA